MNLIKICMYLCICIRMSTDMCYSSCVFMHNVCIYMYVCIYIYIYRYIRTCVFMPTASHGHRLDDQVSGNVSGRLTQPPLDTLLGLTHSSHVFGLPDPVKRDTLIWAWLVCKRASGSLVRCRQPCARKGRLRVAGGIHKYSYRCIYKGQAYIYIIFNYIYVYIYVYIYI